MIVLKSIAITNPTFIWLSVCDETIVKRAEAMDITATPINEYVYKLTPE